MRTNFVHLGMVLVCLFSVQQCKNVFQTIDQKYPLVSESYNIAKRHFNDGRTNYNRLKTNSLLAINTFLDLVFIINEEMARELRSAIVKFYKIKYFHDFTNYAISMEEMIDIADHCLIEPVEKLQQIREQFHQVVRNFEDVRNFKTVDRCGNQLPDEVAAAHCILHQAVIFNETMQVGLVTIVEIKTRQYAQDMNTSIHNVQECLTNFVPKFFDQLLISAYTPNCEYLKVVNASISDLVRNKWKANETLFPTKWSPLVSLMKEKSRQPLKESLLLTLFTANTDIPSNMY